MVTPIDPASAVFLYAENRSMPMHVGGLQLFKKPADAGRNYGQEWYHNWRDVEQIAPLFLKRPSRSLTTAGQYVWAEDDLFDIDHHVRHSALPKPGRVRELLDLCSRLHGTRLGLDRPLWEAHVIEGPAGRAGSALHEDAPRARRRCLGDEDAAVGDEPRVPTAETCRRRGPPSRGWPRSSRPAPTQSSESAEIPVAALRSALGISADAAGLPGALVKSLSRSARSEASPISFRAPKTLLNQPITGARRFAAQSWEIERMRAVGKASGATINDVVLAMCGGALRTYLLDLDGLPDESLVSMVPVSLHGRSNAPRREGRRQRGRRGDGPSVDRRR